LITDVFQIQSLPLRDKLPLTLLPVARGRSSNLLTADIRASSASNAEEIQGQERLNIFIRPTSGDALQSLREPLVGIVSPYVAWSGFVDTS
jgi:hypothetical protein